MGLWERTGLLSSEEQQGLMGGEGAVLLEVFQETPLGK